MDDTPSFRKLIEMVDAKKEVCQIELPITPSQCAPVFSTKTIDMHYGILYKNYIKKALAGEGPFQVAGATLHTLFFEQFKKPSPTNKPNGISQELINRKFDNFANFKTEMKEAALGIHGSGWVYLSTSGAIKTIPNHKVVSDVAVIVDMWEHSYILDYGTNKDKYLKDIWQIIDWDIINVRLN